MARFKSFYNVLEYYFDSAAGTRELEQLIAVLRTVFNADGFKSVIQKHRESGYIANSLKITSGETIPALPSSGADPIAEYANLLYAVHNASIHSKRERKGQKTPRFVPSLEEEDLLRDELPVLQDLAGFTIEKLAVASSG